MSDCDDSEDGRLASLDALRLTLSSAPFIRQDFSGHSERKTCAEKPSVFAVTVRRLSFAYEGKRALNTVSLRVPLSTIYALLGCSGAGKTTLLGCLSGRLRAQSGQIRVFGHDPTKRPVPGLGVGLMPQTTALHEELTIEETLQFFGRLHGLPMALLYQRLHFLREIFHLPEDMRRIDKLSQSQRWRLSLAIALVHSPPLLLLDEPTVSVDPTIRASVWDHLRRLCAEEGLTVLVTTPYAEEVSGAHTIGLLRNGRLLAEDEPRNLLSRFKSKSFDALFLKISEIDRNFNSQHNSEHHSTDPEPTALWSHVGLCERRLLALTGLNFRFDRFFASLLKNAFVLRGKPFLLLFFFLFPVLQLLLFSLANIGRSLHGIPVAVVTSGQSSAQDFLRSLDNRLMRTSIESTIESAIDGVTAGRVWMAIEMQSATNNQTTRIKVFSDLSNAFIARELLSSLRNSLSDRQPLVVREVLFGREDSFAEFLVPAVVSLLVVIPPMLLSATLLLKDQFNGLLERSLSAGQSALELLSSHFFVQSFVLALHELSVLSAHQLLFSHQIRGPFLPVLLLLYIQGLVGVAFGLLIACLSPNATAAIVGTSGTVIPGLLLSGVFWPVEAMPSGLRLLSRALPLTDSIAALRVLMSRAVSPADPRLLFGVLWPMSYALLASIASIAVFKWRTHS